MNEYVRNVMGSSAGAGSGDFHIYRYVNQFTFFHFKYTTLGAFADEKINEKDIVEPWQKLTRRKMSFPNGITKYEKKKQLKLIR